jgi:hypothetical protein
VEGAAYRPADNILGDLGIEVDATDSHSETAGAPPTSHLLDAGGGVRAGLEATLVECGPQPTGVTPLLQEWPPGTKARTLDQIERGMVGVSS